MLTLRRIFCILLICAGHFTALAQQDSTAPKKHAVLSPVDPKTVTPFLSDSAIAANQRKYTADSIAMSFLIPDSNRKSQLWEKVLKTDIYQVFEQPVPIPASQIQQKNGVSRSLRAPWVLVVLLVLLLYTGVLNLVTGADIRAVIMSFFSKNALSAGDKEAGMINSRAFIGLFVLFCLAAGLVAFLAAQYYGLVYRVSGAQLFILLAVATGVLLIVKFLVLKFIGYIFELNSVISEYIAVLNLTYFNVAFVLLAAAACLSLVAARFIPLLLTLTIVLTGIIFAGQYLRNSVNIISGFRFQKFYLFLYLCALEICPILILIKALNV